jgi:hypothetical protein
MAASPQFMDTADVRKLPPTAEEETGVPAVPAETLDRFCIETLLSVPVEIVFQYSSQEGRPLLTRAEAETFLKVSFLAQEMDILIKTVEGILKQQRNCYQHQRQLLNSNLHPMLRPVLPIMSLLQKQMIPNLRNLQNTLCQLVSEMLSCAATLRQSAEQNWTLSETLENLASGQSLSEEKRKLADLEEEVCQRIERIIAISNQQEQDAKTKSSQGDNDNHCRILFGEAEDLESKSGGPGYSESKKDERDYALDISPISNFCSSLFQMSFVLEEESPTEPTEEEEDNDDDKAVARLAAASVIAVSEVLMDEDERNTGNEWKAQDTEDVAKSVQQLKKKVRVPISEEKNDIIGEENRMLSFPPIRTQLQLTGSLSNDDDDDDDDDVMSQDEHMGVNIAPSQIANSQTAAATLAVMAHVGEM